MNQVLVHPARMLDTLPTKGRAQIAGITAVDSENMRLMAMGLHKGLEIVMKNNSGRGPVVIAFGNSRLAVGRSLARKILVV